MRSSLLILAAGLMLAAVSLAPLPGASLDAQAQASNTRCAARTPGPGTRERKEILDALRPRIEAMVGKKVEFVVARLDVACGYARLLAQPQEPGGNGDRYEMIDAFFVKRQGVWRFAMMTTSEEGDDPGADQIKARYPKAPEVLLYL